MREKIFIYEEDFQKAREEIKKNKDKLIIFCSKNDELNRKILEKEKIDVLLINLAGRKDWQKQRNSGLNSVMAKIAKKNSIRIGINFEEILNSVSLKDKSNILSRIQQNILLCSKNKIKMIFLFPFGIKRDSYDLKSLGIILKMPSWMVKDCSG